MNSLDLTPFWLTLELSFWTTLILLFLGIPLAYFLAYSRSRYTSLVEALVSLPLVHPLTAGFRSVPKNLIKASYTLGKSKCETLIKVILPNMKASVLTGIVLSFARTLGELRLLSKIPHRDVPVD